MKVGQDDNRGGADGRLHFLFVSPFSLSTRSMSSPLSFLSVHNCAAHTPDHKPKLTHFGWFTNCVTMLPDIPQTSRIMLISLLTYAVIQIPSLYYHTDKDGGVAREKPWALACLIVSGIGFLIYCYGQVLGAEASERDRRLQEFSRREAWKKSLDRKFSERAHQAAVFRMYDKDGSGYIEPAELALALDHLGLKCARKDITELMSAIDIGHHADGDAGKSDGKISLHEFEAAIDLWVAAGQDTHNINDTNAIKKITHQESHKVGGTHIHTHARTT